MSKRPSGDCPLCGTFRRWLQRDHIIPKHLGGTNDANNVQYICANCHEDKTQEENIARRMGAKASEETRLRQSLAHLGKRVGPCTEDRKQKLRIANKGQIPWNKGMKLVDRKRPV